MMTLPVLRMRSSLVWPRWETDTAVALKRFVTVTTKACVSALRVLWWLPFCAATQAGSPLETTIWFYTPGTNFTESTPLGNGRLGAMMFGGIDEERIIL